jgi:hypothetical protein
MDGRRDRCMYDTTTSRASEGKVTEVLCYELTLAPANSQDLRSFVGGVPPLPIGSRWPSCGMCGDDLTHFLDVELPDNSSPFKAGSRLQVFACRGHDDIAGTIYSNYEQFRSAALAKRLPDNYWNINDGHYLLRLLPPNSPVICGPKENRLALQNLSLTPIEDSEIRPVLSFKLFGQPSWAQDAEEHVCCCGSPMRLLLQIPDSAGFDMVPGAPEQPNSFSRSQYCLFLGNELYLLACTAQCHPLALWPVLQHS